MNFVRILFSAAFALSLAIVNPVSAEDTLKGPDAFKHITDEIERSIEIFQEMAKVIEHPRCMNCHPRTDNPTQGDNMVPHQPPIRRGAANFGEDSLNCRACHGYSNTPYAGQSGSVPGAEHWELAPLSMGWVGMTTGEICEQMKDPERNGGRDLAAIDKHMSPGGDVLVGWSWEPGEGRSPVPGDWETFGALTTAWVETGGHCPDK